MASQKRYALGVDYGTESGRALLVEVATGKEVASHVVPYPDGVIDHALPSTGKRLPHDWALENPADYLTVLERAVPAVMKAARIKPEQVVGIGIDFTACTMLPIDAEGTPLCMLDKWRANPHAWVKLWKHHAAQPHADKINEIARKRKEPWLKLYGGKISSEWMFAKIWQILDEAPAVYKAADRFLEAGDWVVMQLTGVETRNACMAGYKAIWQKGKGYPSKAFFKALDPRLENVVAEKLPGPVLPQGAKAGELTPTMAKLLGLKAGTAVAVANVDAHVAVPASTITGDGKMLMIMGTSICHMVMGPERKVCEGMCGVVEDGILAGHFGFEAGQSGAGDILAWYVKNGVPHAYELEAKKRKLGIHDLLTEKAAALAPGESGLLALDWLNGNRSVLVDVNLTGMILGMTLATKPEEIYRALIESLAYGTRTIIDAFEGAGVRVKELYACGGLPEKNPLLMQIFSDVTGRTIKIAASPQTPALGSAMFGAVAAGKAAGGHGTIQQAAKAMATLKKTVYKPRAKERKVYAQLFAEYATLHDYFGRDGKSANPVMKTLKAIKRAQAKH